MKTPHDLPPGTHIQTTQSNGSTDWQEDAHQVRVWGQKGIIVGHHDSHGLVYCVAHFRSGLEGGNSTIAYYEPGEFNVLTLPVPLHQSHFPLTEGISCGSDESAGDYNKRVMLAQFVSRYKTCNRNDVYNNQQMSAGQPMVMYCCHCRMMCDILPEDFVCIPRNVCTPCQQLVDLRLMEEAITLARSD